MKKLLILPLLLGVFSVCFASSGTISSCTTDVFQEITQGITLNEIFTAAVVKFQEEYGIEISLSALWNGYDEGAIIVTEVSPGHFIVSIDGNDGISILEDYI